MLKRPYPHREAEVSVTILSGEMKEKKKLNPPFEPSYRSAWSSGELSKKWIKARDLLSSCSLCPRNCRVNRLTGEKGFCGQGTTVKVARALPHFGEEPPLSGRLGAGTVFFSGCALGCLFCQNFQISQEGLGEEMDEQALARIFLGLQDRGCHNLDLVSPTPHLAHILKALEIAIPLGLRLPLVYNTHGYLSETSLDLLEGIVDIYLPDLKYGDNLKAYRLSRVDDYTSKAVKSIGRMFRQVGPLQIDDRGIAYRGLLVRHLVLPDHQSGSREALRMLADLSPAIPLSLMAQYRPCFKAYEVLELDRTLFPGEYQEILALAEQLGFEEIFFQELDSSEVYYPDFSLEDPFRPS